MIDISLDDVFTEKNINLALEHLSEKKESCGIDGIPLSEVDVYWKYNKNKILDTIYAGKYEVGIVKQTDILVNSKKRRTVSTMNSVDRLLSRALLQVVAPIIDTVLSDKCFAYRNGMCTRDMAEMAACYIEAGNEWVTEIDVKGFFDTIPHDRMRDKIQSLFSDNLISCFISSFIRCKVDDDGDVHYLNQGLIQGSPLSPLLSNIYLSEFDSLMQSIYGCYCRYGDDVRVYSLTVKEAENAKKTLEKHLIDECLRINGQKSGVYTAINRPCLGYEFYEKGGHVYAQRIINTKIKLLSDEKRHLKLARKLQNANIFNLRANLRYYERRRHSTILKDAIECITDILEKVKKVSTIDNILMYEAQARQKYYTCFNEILNNDDFRFVKRSRRPPEDPLNAMISFGNTLLYTRIGNEIYRSSLDIRFGILHNSVRRAESLNLDLADLFKPVLIDRTIFTLVNRNMMGVSTDFRSMDDGGVYLSENGKRTFIKELERKLYQNIKTSNGVKTYEQLIRDEVRNLCAYFRSGYDYKPYRYVN